MSPIVIDIPDSPPRHSSDPSELGIPSNDITNFCNNFLALLSLKSPSPFSCPDFPEDIEIPDLESPPRSPLSSDIDMYDIPASLPSSPPHIESIPDSPPPRHAGLPLIPVPPASPTPLPLTRRKTSPPVLLPSSPRPTRRVQTPPANGYSMVPALPIITSHAARLRVILAERRREDATLMARLDSVRTHIADVERQILALEALQAMRPPAKHNVG